MVHYEVNSGWRFWKRTADIVGYPDIVDKSITCLRKYHGATVTSVRRLAFMYSDLEFLTLPETIKKIGDHAFSDCYFLKEINIPDTVDTINDSTFDLCESLTSIRLPNSIKSLGLRAFRGCFSLESISIPDTFVFVSFSCFRSDYRLQSINVRFGSSDDWLGAPIRIFESVANLDLERWH